MKRLIIALILSGFITTSLIFSLLYVKSVCKETKKLLSDCVNAYDNNHQTYKNAKKLSQFWEEKEKSLSIFVNHDTLDEIEAAIKSLKDYSDTDDNEIFYEYCGSVEILIHQLLEDTNPSIHSIF